MQTANTNIYCIDLSCRIKASGSKKRIGKKDDDFIVIIPIMSYKKRGSFSQSILLYVVAIHLHIGTEKLSGIKCIIEPLILTMIKFYSYNVISMYVGVFELFL